MNKLTLIFILLISISSCKGQTEKAETNKIIGGPCQDCEATLDYKALKIKLKPTDTLIGFKETEPKIKITGIVLKKDGKTPVENIILYVYQTNRTGIYEPSENPIGWEKRHGKFRGWMKTGSDGKFEFYTFRPAHYPNTQEPEHIHLYVKEPNKNSYYVDSYLFADDPLLTKEEKSTLKNRAGSGIIELEMKNGILTGNREIILGLNIPDYK